jgi:hypothetical protein
MAETEVVRCAACAVKIATQDGHYHLADGHYHPECYDRKQLEALPRTIWARPPLYTSPASRANSNI